MMSFKKVSLAGSRGEQGVAGGEVVIFLNLLLQFAEFTAITNVVLITMFVHVPLCLGFAKIAIVIILWERVITGNAMNVII